MDINKGRRLFLSTAFAGGAGLAAHSATALAASAGKPADVNATEDLMREHGVLRRVLLIYREIMRRIRAGSPPSAEAFTAAAGIIRDFIERYHEKLEEEEVFPRLEKAGKLTDLTHVLRAQHAAGRRLTEDILKKATPASLKDKSQTHALVTDMERFIRMYEPHASREDTVLFPAFHDLFTEKEFDALGERFEEKEHQVLGSEGFEGTVNTVAQLEKSLGIYDLAQFTPP
jgi:hemerythrin-like domain-containing protein